MIPCKTLRHVTLTGYSNYFGELDRFFAAFGSTIESLTLSMSLQDSRPNGKILEYDLLNKMPCLSSFDFLLTSHSVSGSEDAANDIRTFQAVTWLKFNPVVFWNDFPDGSSTICTLPYKLDHVRDSYGL